jgi:hypothetical protein
VGGRVSHRSITHCIILNDSTTLAIGWIGLPICPCEATLSARFKRCLSIAIQKLPWFIPMRQILEW